MADQPDEPMDISTFIIPDLTPPSTINVLTETQAAAATSALPSAEPPTITVRKSKAEKQREYRQRLAATRTSEELIAARKLATERQRICRLRKTANFTLVSGTEVTATRQSAAEKQRNYRLRKAANSALVTGSLESTTAYHPTGSQRQLTHKRRRTSAAESVKIDIRQAQWNTKWASSIMRFESTFLDNDFGHACSVCDRLWCKNDLKPITEAQLEVISKWFIKENRQLCKEDYERVCNICKRTLNKKSMPPLAKVNGFSYPDRPPDLPPLDPISERLISPRLPFMQVRRLRYDYSHGVIAQVINIPLDEQETVKCLPRQLNEDDVINVNIERSLAYNSVYLSGYMSDSTIGAWLTALHKSPLYRLYEINVDMSRLYPPVSFLDDIQEDPSNRIENIYAENTPGYEILASRQHTMMWNEKATPLNVNYHHAEELSFPSIYFGEPRRFNKGVLVTPHMIAASEIRRCDRRGATPQKILYVAMKLLRLRIVDGISSTLRNVSAAENVTRRKIEDTEFQKESVIENLAVMKSVPNSVQYWASRKRDLFAIIRQLGKPTVSLTIRANEIHWMKLLSILLKLSKKYPGKTAKDLDTSERCTLVSDDPVTCCVYFYKLVDSLIKMLKSKQSYNPFGKYFVKDYFLRINFQHRGSPYAHCLLWLNDDPREAVSENMPRTVDLVEKLSSVARNDVPNDSVYANQTHKHTLTCTKLGETACRYGIPYWPMPTTRVLLPIPQSDLRRRTLQQKAKKLCTSLGERRYTCMDDFLNANGLNFASYLDIVRSTLRRPTLMFRRNFDKLMTNTFNPYLAGEVNSSIEIQFILDEYSCAEYVVECVNKSAREKSELAKMMREHPDRDFTGQLEDLSIKLLDAVEMSAQEAAWFLLRQPMSETSRHVVYIPTVWPSERQCSRKLRRPIEGTDGDSTEVWTKNIIQRYEERPASLEQVYLAEFAAWYANANDFVDEEDDAQADDDEDSEAVPTARTSRPPKEYRRRPIERVIRYRRYDIDNTVDYKREMVLLYVQFRNEMTEILDQNKFLQLFDNNKNTIMERHSLYETNLNIQNVMKELEAMINFQNDDNSDLASPPATTQPEVDVCIKQEKVDNDDYSIDDFTSPSEGLNADATATTLAKVDIWIKEEKVHIDSDDHSHCDSTSPSEGPKADTTVTTQPDVNVRIKEEKIHMDSDNHSNDGSTSPSEGLKLDTTATTQPKVDIWIEEEKVHMDSDDHSYFDPSTSHSEGLKADATATTQPKVDIWIEEEKGHVDNDDHSDYDFTSPSEGLKADATATTQPKVDIWIKEEEVHMDSDDHSNDGSTSPSESLEADTESTTPENLVVVPDVKSMVSYFPKNLDPSGSGLVISSGKAEKKTSQERLVKRIVDKNILPNLKRLTYTTKLRQNIILKMQYSSIIPFRHNSKYLSDYICYFCENSYEEIEKLAEHTESQHVGKVSDKTILRLMRSRGHNLINADISCIKCRLCLEDVKTIENLIDHLVKVHNKVYHETADTSYGILGFDLGTKELKCHLCGEAFDRFMLLYSHMNGHYEANENVVSKRLPVFCNPEHTLKRLTVEKI